MSTPSTERNDVFIAHASEDKDRVARPLAKALIAQGWSVWLDELKLTIGDSLNDRIESALASTRFGIVILSPAFFAKEWPKRELAALVAREVGEGVKVILPVWHNVDEAYLLKRSPILADRYGAQMSAGVDQVAQDLSQVLRGTGGSERKPTGATEAAKSKRVRRATGASERMGARPPEIQRPPQRRDTSRQTSSPQSQKPPQESVPAGADLDYSVPEAAWVFLVLAHMAPVGALIAQAQLPNPGEAAAIPIWLVGFACGFTAWGIAGWLMGSSRSDRLGGYLETPVPYFIVGFLLWLIFGFALYS